MGHLRVVILITVLTFISGVCDAFGFVHAARIWQGKTLLWTELVKSGCGFTLGISTYWVVVRYLNLIGVWTPEMQTLLWFGTTLVGVALLSGSFLSWHPVDQGMALVVLGGIGWLLVRTGA